jgi:hypothetical protein
MFNASDLVLQIVSTGRHITINGKDCKDANEIVASLRAGSSCAVLPAVANKSTFSVNSDSGNIPVYQIKVKQYMTQPGSPSFDFMSKYNNDVPMPLRVMVGTKEKETPGMVYMKLHGEITEEKTYVCMRCGKLLSNPVSQYFGVGPECGGHNYVNPFKSDAELKAAVDAMQRKLKATVWEGWVIKKAIESEKILRHERIK